MATIVLAGTGIGIPLIFSLLLEVYSINKYADRLFTFTLLSFTLTEALALFALLIVFLILLGF